MRSKTRPSILRSMRSYLRLSPTTVWRRRALWRELDGYTTEDSLADIEAAIARSEAEDDPETRELRSIIAAKRVQLLQRSA